MHYSERFENCRYQKLQIWKKYENEQRKSLRAKDIEDNRKKHRV